MYPSVDWWGELQGPAWPSTFSCSWPSWLCEPIPHFPPPGTLVPTPYQQAWLLLAVVLVNPKGPELPGLQAERTHDTDPATPSVLPSVPPLGTASIAAAATLETIGGSESDSDTAAAPPAREGSFRPIRFDETLLLSDDGESEELMSAPVPVVEPSSLRSLSTEAVPLVASEAEAPPATLSEGGEPPPAVTGFPHPAASRPIHPPYLSSSSPSAPPPSSTVLPPPRSVPPRLQSLYDRPTVLLSARGVPVTLSTLPALQTWFQLTVHNIGERPVEYMSREAPIVGSARPYVSTRLLPRCTPIYRS